MKIRLDRTDKITEIISFLFLLTSGFILLYDLPTLPNRVPTHFTKGVVVLYESKNVFWLTFIVALISYCGLTILAKYPTFYKNRLTNSNIKEQ